MTTHGIGELLIGTCSWNYDSWINLVYTTPCPTAAEYLQEYSKKYRTAEIDSWFYKIPNRGDVLDYLGNVDDEFRFTCKVSNVITLTHERSAAGQKDLKKNDSFLSIEKYLQYIDAIEPMLSRVDGIMLEFEYLNKEKMQSVSAFMKAIEQFEHDAPKDLPLAVETRNKNYLCREYFQFLKEKMITHVFSEKIYMPHCYEVYEAYGDLLEGKSIVRLLGGDRSEIEIKTNNLWNRIVDEKKDLKNVADMVGDMLKRNMKVTVNVNNHYEGSSPLTIARFEELIAAGPGRN